MFRGCLALGVILSGGAALGQAPVYTASSVVNSSDYSAGPFAPGSLISIFGTNLSFSAAGLTADNVNGSALPFYLGNTSVVIDNVLAPLLYVSPTQINAMVPPNETAGNVTLQVIRQGMSGPAVTIPLVNGAPALFVGAGNLALAQDFNAKYAVATAASPAHPGDLLVLYATGLGGTQPLPRTGEIPQFAGTWTGSTPARCRCCSTARRSIPLWFRMPV